MTLTPDEEVLAAHILAATPAVDPPAGLLARIEQGVAAEQARRRRIVRSAWGAIAATALLAALALPWRDLVQPPSRRLLSDARVERAFAQWDEEYLASQRESDAALSAAATPVDILLTADGAAPLSEPDPIAPLVGF